MEHALIVQLYRQLRECGDNFYHWMTPMYDISDADYDSTLSSSEQQSTRRALPHAELRTGTLT